MQTNWANNTSLLIHLISLKPSNRKKKSYNSEKIEKYVQKLADGTSCNLLDVKLTTKPVFSTTSDIQTMFVLSTV